MKWAHKPSFIIIACLLAGAALLRLAGVPYGLPLRLIADEPQYILTGLLMVQEGVLLPPAYLRDFEQLLYSPPHTIYLFLLPFWFLRYVVETQTLIPYFITARLAAVGAGLAAIWFTYQASRRLIPQSKTAPFFSSYFLATSILAIAGSSSARHWPFAAFLGILAFAILVDTRKPFPRRYLKTAAIAGIGIGINQVVGALLAVAVGWYLVMERGSVKRLFSSWWFAAGAGVFAMLAALPFLMFSQSLRGVGGKLWSSAPTFAGFISAPVVFLAPILRSEPILMLFVLAGFAALWRQNRRLFWFLLAMIIGYTETFQTFYFFQHRFLGILMPFLALVAGFGAAALLGERPWRRWRAAALTCLLLVPLIVSLRFSYLLFHDDSRARARAWFETHIPEGSRVMVWARLTRLSSLPGAIEEKALIEDARNLDDGNEHDFPNVPWGPRFHALNLFDVENESFYNQIVRYACVREYDYLIIQESDFQSPLRRSDMTRLTEGAQLLKSFGASDEQYSVTATQFNGWPWGFLRLREFGPPISIWRLKRDILCPDQNEARLIFRGEDFITKGTARVRRFILDERSDLRIDIASDNPAVGVLFLEREFEKAQRNEPSRSIARVRGPSAMVPLEKGSYIFAVGAEDRDVRYVLTMRADDLIFSDRGFKRKQRFYITG